MQKKQNVKKDYRISWNTMPLSQWESLYQDAVRPSLLQSQAYADVMARLNHQRVQRGVFTIDLKPAALVQILEAGILKNAIQGVIADCTPVWINEHGSLDDFEGFMEAFSAAYPKRLGRRVRFVPNIENTPQALALMQKHGYVRKSPGGYQTIWMDLSKNEDELRQNLRSNWLGALRRAEKQGLDIVLSDKGLHFPWLIDNYIEDKDGRGYNGVSAKLAYALGLEFLRKKNMLVGTALLEEKPIAAILIFVHGKSATYQIGYNSALGREKCAHHLLLWRACCVLKERNINAFDLGGINDGDAEGVKAFKKGLGGDIVETAGFFR